MNSIVEDIIDLLQDKSNLSSPYRSVFVISSSCFFKMLSSIFFMLLKKGERRRKWVAVSIFKPQKHIGLIQSFCVYIYDNANDSNLNAILLAILSNVNYLFQNRYFLQV